MSERKKKKRKRERKRERESNKEDTINLYIINKRRRNLVEMNIITHMYSSAKVDLWQKRRVTLIE